METDYGHTIAGNLRRILEERDMSPADLARALNVSQATVSFWLNNKKTPKASTIDKICECLRISPSDLVEEKADYYINPETAQVAQEIFDNPDLGLLFDEARDADPEDLKAIHSMLLALKRKEKRE